MRRDRIIIAAGNIREALHAAHIRELLREARTGQPAGGEGRSQRIFRAYHEFLGHYRQFGEEEKQLIALLGLSPLLDTGFWSALLDGGQTVDRKLLSDVEVAAYNAVFVMPKLREILARETDKGDLTVADRRGAERPVKCLRILVGEQERSLTDPNTLVTVIRAMDKLYKAISVLHGGRGIGLAIGSIDSGSAKSFDFFGASAVIEEIGALLLDVWDKIKYCAGESRRYQIEIAMVAIGFVMRVKNAEAQSIIDAAQVQQVTRMVAKSIEILLHCGAYTEEMDAPRETRASRILAPKAPAIEFNERNAGAEAESGGAGPSLDYPARTAGASIAAPAPSISGILSNLRDELEVKAVNEP